MAQKMKFNRSNEKVHHKVASWMIIAGAALLVLLVIGGIVVGKTLFSRPSVTIPKMPDSARRVGDAMVLKTTAERDAYWADLQAAGGTIVAQEDDTVVVQLGLNDIILTVQEDGRTQVVIQEGKEVPWPKGAIGRAFPKPEKGTPVAADQFDDVTMLVTMRDASEQDARDYVNQLIHGGWTITEDDNFEQGTGPFLAELSWEGYVITIDYYAQTGVYALYLMAS